MEQTSVCVCVCSYATALNDVLTFTADNYYLLYFDGALVASRTPSNELNVYQRLGSIPLPNSTRVIAITGYNIILDNRHNPAGIIASDSSGYIWTNSSWRCSKLLVAGWMDVGFNDRGWPYAKEEASNENGDWESLRDIRPDAKWIWTNNFNALTGFPLDMSVYCRLCIGTLDSNYMLKNLSLES